MTTAAIQTSPNAGTRRPILSAGLRAALLAGVAAELFTTAARAAGVPMRAGAIGATTPETLPPGWVALATVACTLAGTVLAAALGRRARRPRRTFTVSASVLTLLSFASPIGAGATTLATKLTLGIAHIIVAAIVIPRLTKVLTENRILR
jgi:hypothetical protein